MHLRLVYLLALLPVLAGAQGVQPFRGEMRAPFWKSSPDVPELLVKAIAEQKKGHYLGVRTVEFLRGPDNLRHDEIVYRDGPRTRIEFPKGSQYAGQIIVETKEDRRHYVPDRNEIQLLPPRREETSDRLVGLARRGAEKKIVLSVEAGEVVAGLQTQQVVAKGPEGLVIQRLYIDPDSGVVLKRIVFDAKGRQIGYFQFRRVNLNPGAFEPSLFRLDIPGARVITPFDTLKDIAGREGFDPILLPGSSGYRLEESRIANIKGDRVLVETYGSGHGRLTLFELRTAVSPEKLRLMSHGDFQAYTRPWGSKFIVLLGPRTQDELGLLAQSLSAGTP